MARGLKTVRTRHNDALSRTAWDRVEHLLAEHYCEQGYAVEHVGTGGTGSRFDGGIDLELRKDEAYLLVQCKHWNAYQVTHNAVHELLGIMVNEGATGAILVTSGEFTRAAERAATRQGHVQLIDGAELRHMLGPLPEPEPEETVAPSTVVDPHARWRRDASAVPTSAAGLAREFGTAAADRLVDAFDTRVKRSGRMVRKSAEAALWAIVAKFAGAALVGLLLLWGITTALRGLTTPHVVSTQAALARPLPAPANTATSGTAVTAMPLPAQTVPADLVPPKAPQSDQPATRPETAAERRAREAYLRQIPEI